MSSSARNEPLLAAPSAAPVNDKNFGLYPLRSHNHNVVVNLLMRFSTGLADSIWSGTVLANFLFHIGGNQYAGYAEAAMGVASLVVALPAGMHTRRIRSAHAAHVHRLVSRRQVRQGEDSLARRANLTGGRWSHRLYSLLELR